MYDKSGFFCDDSDASELGPGLLTPLSPESAELRNCGMATAATPAAPLPQACDASATDGGASFIESVRLSADARHVNWLPVSEELDADDADDDVLLLPEEEEAELEEDV